MIAGVITCQCGQFFGFETAADKVACPACKEGYTAKDFETPEPDPEPEGGEDDADTD